MKMVMRKSLVLLCAAGSLSVLLSGCMNTAGPNVYSAQDVGMAQTVRFGTVIALRPVDIQGQQTPVGTLAGAAVGGIAGSELGGGKGSVITTILGAVVGGVAGTMGEQALTQSQGVEITVREDNGTVRAYVQKVEKDEIFQVGERVRILTANGVSRVSL
jgi:outer membrane lipoprotein SlyB